MGVADELQSLGIRVDDHAFHYRGRSHELRSIAHVGYSATRTKHSVNYVPTGTSFDATCRVTMVGGYDVTIDSPRGWGEDRGKAAIAPVWLFYEVISDMTFEHRLDGYEKGLAARRFVQFGDFQIHETGSVYHRARYVGALRGADMKVSLSPFYLDCAPTKGSKVQIPLDTDKDCALYILKWKYGIRFDGERLRERRSDRRKRMYEAIVALGAKVSKADGQVSADEIREFKTYFRSDEFPLDDTAALFKRAVADSRNVRTIAQELASRIDDDQLLEQVFIGLVRIAWIDDQLAAGEERALWEIGEAFGFSRSHAQYLIDLQRSADAGASNSRGRSRGKAARAGSAEAHLKVLGLQAGASASDVKLAYQRLTQQFHPDILRAKGVPEELVAVGEETLKRINEAYTWLRKNRYDTA